MRISRSHNGFTLVELLVVIIVIALLATITVASYGVAQRNAKMTPKLTAERDLNNAMTSYLSDTRSFPHDEGGAILTTSGKALFDMRSRVKFHNSCNDKKMICLNQSVPAQMTSGVNTYYYYSMWDDRGGYWILARADNTYANNPEYTLTRKKCGSGTNGPSFTDWATCTAI